VEFRCWEKKIAWTKWGDMCKPKEEEGLRINDIKLFNITLLVMWRGD